MLIQEFEFTGPRALRLTFFDGAQLDVVFEESRCRGLQTALLDDEEFARARLVGGTVVWPCGYRLDSQVGRIRADEASIWLPG